MPDTLQSVLIGAVAGGLSSAITYYSTRAKSRLDLTVARELEIHNARLSQYKKLWPLFEELARYGRAKAVTHKVLTSVSDKTREWYYAEGGLYLTAASRKPYFTWKKAMQPLLDDPDLQQQPDRPIPPEAVDHMVRTLSELHASLSEDLDTRRTTLF